MVLERIRHHQSALSIVLSSLLVSAFVLIGLLWWQLDQARKDIQRVESSTALFALQVDVVLAQVAELEPEISADLDRAITGLHSLTEAPLELPVALEESIRIAAQIPLKQDLVVPIELTVPIKESIQTTIEVEGPLGIAVPIQVTIPVELEVPIETDVVVPLDTTVPIEAQVPVQIDALLKLDFRETELAGSLESLIELLTELRTLLASLN